jgi:plasmid stabilization system protein ParE
MPTWRVVIDPQAEAEARASFRWYLARSATAATGFQVALKEAIDSLAEAPYPMA